VKELLALPTNIRLGWKLMAMINALVNNTAVLMKIATQDVSTNLGLKT
jgi:hypothetical protein